MATSKLIGTDVDLSCSICKEIFKEPRIARCGHSFCRVCLEGVLRDIPMTAEDPALAQSGASSTFEFTCPFLGCGIKSRLRRADIDEFPPNFILAEVVKRNSKELMTRCKIHQMECNLFCLHCKEEICIRCLSEHGTSPHSALAKEEAVDNFQNRAEQHIKEACEDLKSFKVKVAELLSKHEDEQKIAQEFSKLETIFIVLDEAISLIEDLKAKLSVEFLSSNEGNQEKCNLRKEYRENLNMRNAIVSLKRAVQKQTANVFNAIECEEMALHLKDIANRRLRESSTLENRECAIRMNKDPEEILAAGIQSFINKINSLLLKHEIILQKTFGILEIFLLSSKSCYLQSYSTFRQPSCIFLKNI